MNSGEIALFAAAIGASAAILSQLIVFLLTRNKEKGNLKKELIAEERRLSYLLSEYYKEYVLFRVHKEAYHRAANLYTTKSEFGHEQYAKSNLFQQKYLETQTKIRVTASEYFKTVTHFTNLAGENKMITKQLKNIKEFEPRKPTKFEEVQYKNLSIETENEEASLNKVYLYYSECFDKINEQLIKS